jgi:CheY-like chemotaxis protein
MLDRIEASLSTLPAAEQRVAKLVLKNPRQFSQLPVGELAAMAHVSKPTVVRFCRSMGYDGLSDFKLKLAGTVSEGVPYIHRSVDAQDKVPDVAVKVIDNAVAAFHFHAEPKTPRPLGGGETILLVDDETSLRELGRQSLEGVGYRVITAASGEEALAIFQARSAEIDLVVMDLGMPGMGGHKCLQAILDLDPHAKVVIASGYSANGQVRQSLESGAAGYVAKPYRRRDLLTTIRDVLDRK